MLDLAVLAQRLRAEGLAVRLRRPQPQIRTLIELVGPRPPACGRGRNRVVRNVGGPNAPLLLVLIFIVVPIAELALLIQVGQEIGVWWTIALLVADSILGSLLMRSQGRAAWRRFNVTLQAGRPARARGARRRARHLRRRAAADARASSATSSGSCCCSRPRARSCGAILVRRFADRMIASATRRGAGRLRAAARARRAPGPATSRARRSTSTPTGCRGARGERAGADGGEGFTDAVTFAFADRAAGFFGLARAGVARAADGPAGQRARRAVRRAASRSGCSPRAATRSARRRTGTSCGCPGSSCARSSRGVRWQVVLEAPGGSGLRPRVHGGVAAGRARGGRRGGAPRRHGGARAALPRLRHRGRAPDRLPRPARPHLGHRRLEPDRAHALARRRGSRRAAR